MKVGIINGRLVIDLYENDMKVLDTPLENTRGVTKEVEGLLTPQVAYSTVTVRFNGDVEPEDPPKKTRPGCGAIGP